MLTMSISNEDLRKFGLMPRGRPPGSLTVSQLETPEELVAEAKRIVRRAIRNAGPTITVSRARQMLGMLKDISALERDARVRNAVEDELAKIHSTIKRTFK